MASKIQITSKHLYEAKRLNPETSLYHLFWKAFEIGLMTEVSSPLNQNSNIEYKYKRHDNYISIHKEDETNPVLFSLFLVEKLTPCVPCEFLIRGIPGRIKVHG